MKSGARFLLYTHEFPPFKGGAGEYCSQIAAALSLKGCSVTIALPNDTVWKTVSDLGQGSRIVRLSKKIATAKRVVPVVAHRPLPNRSCHYRGCPVAISDFLVIPPPFLRYSIVVHGTEISNNISSERVSCQ